VVVVHGEVEDAAGLVDVLADLLGVSDRILLAGAFESPVERVLADDADGCGCGDDGGGAVVQVPVVLLMLLIRCRVASR
jgi:hypothetical protein